LRTFKNNQINKRIKKIGEKTKEYKKYGKK
jgi:hypothetical protein